MQVSFGDGVDTVTLQVFLSKLSGVPINRLVEGVEGIGNQGGQGGGITVGESGPARTDGIGAQPSAREQAESGVVEIGG